MLECFWGVFGRLWEAWGSCSFFEMFGRFGRADAGRFVGHVSTVCGGKSTWHPHAEKSIRSAVNSREVFSVFCKIRVQKLGSNA